MEGKQKIVNIASIILATASCGLAGFSYATKCIAYKEALASAQYNAQLVEAQKNAVEALHQSAVEALNTGNPLFDSSEISPFVGMKGKFDALSEKNPELASKIMDWIQSNQTIDAYNQYAQERGFADYNEFLQAMDESFAHLFNADGTLSATATMKDIDLYYWVGADVYNYLGDEAVKKFADEILLAGIDPATLEGAQIVVTPVTDATGTVVNTWTVDLAPDAVNAIDATSGLDAGEILGTGAIAVLAGCGAYFVGKKILNHFANRGGVTPASEPVDEAHEEVSQGQAEAGTQTPGAGTPTNTPPASNVVSIDTGDSRRSSDPFARSEEMNSNR